jgi:hypothetical protein
MKVHSRSVAAVVLAVILSIPFAAIAAASPREPETIRTRVERILHKLQRFISLVPLDNGPIPPIPEPKP